MSEYESLGGGGSPSSSSQPPTPSHTAAWLRRQFSGGGGGDVNSNKESGGGETREESQQWPDLLVDRKPMQDCRYFYFFCKEFYWNRKMIYSVLWTELPTYGTALSEKLDNILFSLA